MFCKLIKFLKKKKSNFYITFGKTTIYYTHYTYNEFSTNTKAWVWEEIRKKKTKCGRFSYTKRKLKIFLENFQFYMKMRNFDKFYRFLQQTSHKFAMINFNYQNI